MATEASTITDFMDGNLIYIKDTKHALLCPNQDHEYGNIIDNISPHFDHTGTGKFTIKA